VVSGASVRALTPPCCHARPSANKHRT
jgi:hypothetical protein